MEWSKLKYNYALQINLKLIYKMYIKNYYYFNIHSDQMNWTVMKNPT